MDNNNQNICTRCGFYCDGTLFSLAKIKEAEQIATGFSFDWGGIQEKVRENGP
jgi:hypothetical protein